MNIERQIISQLIKNFQKIVPNGRITGKRLGGKADPYDLILDVQIDRAKKKFLCEVKSVGEPRYLYQAIGQLKSGILNQKGTYPVIIAPYISEQGRNICRDAEVGFIDLQGNVFLKFDGVLIDVRYEKRKGRGISVRVSPPVAVADSTARVPIVKVERRTLKRLFSPVSSRVLRVMLENSKEIWTLKALSEEAKASLKQTFLVVNSLDMKGFLERKRGAIALTKPAELIDLWAADYSIKNNETRIFYSFEKSPADLMKTISQVAQHSNLRYAFTLHSGASLVAPFVRGVAMTYFYIGSREDLDTWIKALDLRVVESGGNVHILVPYDKGVFYNTQAIRQMQVVGNIQLYLDLYNYPTRGREQAEFLRAQKIGF